MHWRESKTNSQGQSYIFLNSLVHQGTWEGQVVFSKQGDQLGFSIFLINDQLVILFSIHLATSVRDTESTSGTAYRQKTSSELIFREDTVSIICSPGS